MFARADGVELGKGYIATDFSRYSNRFLTDIATDFSRYSNRFLTDKGRDFPLIKNNIIIDKLF